MSVLNIQTGLENEILRKKSINVVNINKSTKKLIKNMHETLITENGLGLAAPQVGENVRVILVLLDYKSKNERIVHMINPEIIFFSIETETAEEGCLSLPEQFDDVERSKKINIKYQDLKNNSYELSFEKLNARIIQHEVDHLNGVLFLDKTTSQGYKNNKPAHQIF